MFELLIVNIKVRFPMFQWIVWLFLQCGHQKPKPGIEGLNAFNSRKTKSLVSNDCLQEFRDAIQPVKRNLIV